MNLKTKKLQMRIMLIGVAALGFSSCGIKHKISGTPEKITVANQGESRITVDKVEFEDIQVNADPVEFVMDFDKVSDTCDRRFGEGTEESNDCFMAALGFFDSEVSLNLEGVVSFCEDQYVEEEDQQNCIDNLTDFLDSQSNGNEATDGTEGGGATDGSEGNDGQQSPGNGNGNANGQQNPNKP